MPGQSRSSRFSMKSLSHQTAHIGMINMIRGIMRQAVLSYPFLPFSSETNTVLT